MQIRSRYLASFNTLRDIALKPENVLYDARSDTLLVADFGIARFEEEMLATAVETKAGAKMANLRYSAPEQRFKGGGVDRRADIYALGLMLNEAFTGLVPQGSGYATVGPVAGPFAYLDDLIGKMIQQQPAARPASIEEVKKQLIGRRNAFIALQTLDAKKKEVVPAAAPGVVAPVEITAGDWDRGNLTIVLNRVPEAGWVQRFYDPRRSYSFQYGLQPGKYQFRGNTVVVSADESQAQVAIEQFRQWSQWATQAFQEEVVRAAEAAEQQAREKLRQEVAAAEAKARVTKSLKF